jgi:hypothetical protein
MEPPGRANARPMTGSAKSGAEPDVCDSRAGVITAPGFRFAPPGLRNGYEASGHLWIAPGDELRDDEIPAPAAELQRLAL